jgi:hypothetical protein
MYVRGKDVCIRKAAREGGWGATSSLSFLDEASRSGGERDGLSCDFPQSLEAYPSFF